MSLLSVPFSATIHLIGNMVGNISLNEKQAETQQQGDVIESSKRGKWPRDGIEPVDMNNVEQLPELAEHCRGLILFKIFCAVSRGTLQWNQRDFIGHFHEQVLHHRNAHYRKLLRMRRSRKHSKSMSRECARRFLDGRLKPAIPRGAARSAYILFPRRVTKTHVYVAMSTYCSYLNVLLAQHALSTWSCDVRVELDRLQPFHDSSQFQTPRRCWPMLIRWRHKIHVLWN